MRLALTAFALSLAAAPAMATPVPFVGCASDGQIGPQPIPKAGPTPDLPPAAATKLAFYAGAEGPGVLAPRGWQCFQTYGSNGESLLVAPHVIGSVPQTPLSGPAVQLSISDGGTSGRFEVAEIAARLFPAAKPFVDGVEAERLRDKYVHVPYPADKITRRGLYEALVTTPANADGIGTSSFLLKGPLPIDNIVLLERDGDMSLIHMAARLSPAQRPLVAYIIAQVAKTK